MIYPIYTHKLNQDGLKNLFAQIRSRGSNEHPTPLASIYRIRMIILGKNSRILDAKVNTKDVVPEEYITNKVLEKVNFSYMKTRIWRKLLHQTQAALFHQWDLLKLMCWEICHQTLI